MRTIAAAAALIVVYSAQANAGPIDQACIRSNQSANRLLCDCIQRVANLTLTSSDQRLAARFFADPGMAQDVRQSKSSNHKSFWDRYVTFGETAEAVCASS